MRPRTPPPRRILTLLLTVFAWAFVQPCGAVQPAPSEANGTGPVHLARPGSAPKGLVLYLRGTPGWGEAAAQRAQDLAQVGYVVAGIEPGALRSPTEPGACWDLSRTGRMEPLADRDNGATGGSG